MLQDGTVSRTVCSGVGRGLGLWLSHGHHPWEVCAEEGSPMWPTGYQFTPHPPPGCGTPQVNQLSTLASICTFLMSQGPERIGLLYCFHTLMTQDSGHLPPQSSRSVFRSRSSHHPSLVTPQHLEVSFGEGHPPASLPLEFCLIYSLVP